MKHLIAALALLAGVGTVCADELSDAASALDKKHYAAAVASYTKLANAGNAEAAFRLGEMYWYGEGVPLDRAKGDALFAKAAAAGNQSAAVSLKLSGQRQARMDDINYWTGGYDGADLTAGKFNCVAPVYPPYSETKRGITAIGDAYAAYVACYNGFVDHLGAAMPAGKRIPEEVALLMSEEELAQARTHLTKVYTAAAERAKTGADTASARHAAWSKDTEQYLATQNQRRDQYLKEMDLQRKSNAGALVDGRAGSRK